MRLQRRTLGPEFTEGARQTWLRLEKKGWSHARLAQELERSHAYVHRVLYGDALPDTLTVIKVEKALGVRCRLWAQPAKNHFIPPAARDAA